MDNSGCSGVIGLVAILGLIAALMFGLIQLNETVSEKRRVQAHLEYTRAQAEATRADARVYVMQTAAQSFAERVIASATAYDVRTNAAANAFTTRLLGTSQAASITVTSMTAAALPWIVTLVALTLIAAAFLAWNARQQGGYYGLPGYHPLPGRRLRYPLLPKGEPPIVVVLPRPGQSRREAYRALESAAQPLLGAGEVGGKE